MNEKGGQLVPIREAAEILGVSMMTLRRWDESGKFPAVKTPGGHRLYKRSQIALFGSSAASMAKEWASRPSIEIPDEFYCPNSAVFQSRLMSMQNALAEMKVLDKNFPLIVAIVGEIGDNSFAHNIGNWSDVPGIFFAYDPVQKQVVLADRGRGVLHTLRRVRPELTNDEDALRVAFTEVVSGRAPEARGNGLKFVRSQVAKHDYRLHFQSGNTTIEIGDGNNALTMSNTEENIRGCFALLSF